MEQNMASYIFIHMPNPGLLFLYSALDEEVGLAPSRRATLKLRDPKEHLMKLNEWNT
jgi:hypothetical protein